MEDQIWVASVTFEDGSELFASLTEAGVQKQVADWCRENWNVQIDFEGEVPNGGEVPLEVIPEDDGEICELYFEYNSETEWCYTDYIALG